MQVDEKLIMEAIQARIDVDTWIKNRPRVGLDVTDVEKLAEGFDHLGQILFGVTGTDIKKIGEKNESIEVRR